MPTKLSADTRAHILETAWELARKGGTSAVSVKEIAAAAGVSRQLVYFHYKNRAGLLLAMARHQDRRSGFIDRVVTTRALPPRESLETLLREWCAYVPEILPVARALDAAQATGAEGSDAWHDRMNDLWHALHIPIERIASEDGLATGWSTRGRHRLDLGPSPTGEVRAPGRGARVDGRAVRRGDDPHRPARRARCLGRAPHAHLVEVGQQVAGVLVDAERARVDQLLAAVAARQQADPERARRGARRAGPRRCRPRRCCRGCRLRCWAAAVRNRSGSGLA